MMRISALLLLAAHAVCAAGCAHHKTNQYAYAPPLAPPVYPQPQTAAQPVVYPAAVPPTAVAPMAGAPVMAAAGPVVAGPVVAASGDPCCPPFDGAGGGTPVVYESEQTPQCPPGP